VSAAGRVARTPLMDLYGPAAKRAWLRARQVLIGTERRRLRIARRFVAEHGLTVHGGPFAGMRYVDRAVGPVLNLIPRLLGAYERELHRPLERAIAARPLTVVNVGSADGYYAVGLARRLPGSTVLAFETDPFLRSLCTEMARANGVVEQLTLRSRCSAADLARLPAGEAFVLVDCEGCEGELLHVDAAPLLARSTVLVELHDFIDPGVGEEIAARFAPTHSVSWMDPEPREAAQYHHLAALARDDRELAIREARTRAVRWALFTPCGPGDGARLG
jgi:hypothetical protein